MFLVIVFISILIFLSIKNKLYIFSIAPFFLLSNYIFFYLIISYDFIKSPFLEVILRLYKLDKIYGFDYGIINSMTFRTGLFYFFILIFSYIFSKQKLIKKLALELIKIIYIKVSNLNLFTKENKNNSIYSITNQITLALIIIHAFSFYTSENLIYHREYLLINKPEFYYFYPFFSILISKILVILLFPLYFISKYLQKGFKGFRKTQTIIIIAHTLIYLSALNSRWLTIYILSFTFFAFYSLITSKKIKRINKSLQSAFVIFVGTFSALYSFQKVIFFRNRLSGVGTVFQFNSFDFQPFESLSTLLLSFLTSLMPFYSGVLFDIKVTLQYALISLSPLPSYLLGENINVGELSERISRYVPSTFYLEIYQAYFVYGIIISLFFGLAFSIVLVQKRILSSYGGDLKIIKLYPLFLEFFLVFSLLFGYQYYARTVMRLFWYAIFIFIILPFLINLFSKLFKRSKTI